VAASFDRVYGPVSLFPLVPHRLRINVRPKPPALTVRLTAFQPSGTWFSLFLFS
jgi:hypothetical protein